MQSEPLDTILVEAPSRFAIIGPGLPIPKIIIASSDQVSDLVGFYSIREAGLENIFSASMRTSSPIDVLINRRVGGPFNPGEPYITFDLWLKNGSDTREQLYSLIIYNPAPNRTNQKFIASFKNKLVDQLERAVKAYHNKNKDELKYLGQMLATFVSLLLERSEYEYQRTKSISSILRNAFIFYIIGTLLAFAILGLANFRNQAGRRLLDALVGSENPPIAVRSIAPDKQ